MRVTTTQSTRLIEAAELTICSERRGHAHLLTLSGDLDMATVRPFEDELRRVEFGDADAIVVDLAALDYLDSHGATSLANAHRRARRDRREFSVHQGAPHIHASFELLGPRRAPPLRALARARFASGSGIGAAASSDRVYACWGREQTASALPSSTILPALITAMRSARWRTTPRSWETNR